MNADEQVMKAMDDKSTLVDLFGDIVDLQRAMIDELARDRSKGMEIDRLRQEIDRLSAHAAEELNRSNAVMYEAISKLPGRCLVVDPTKLKNDDRLQAGVIFRLKDNTSGEEIWKVVAFDARTYQFGDIDFSGIDPSTVRHLLYGGSPLGRTLYECYEEWVRIHAAEGHSEYQTAERRGMTSAEIAELEKAGIAVEKVPSRDADLPEAGSVHEVAMRHKAELEAKMQAARIKADPEGEKLNLTDSDNDE